MSVIFEKLVKRWSAEKFINPESALMRSQDDRIKITLTLISSMIVLHAAVHRRGEDSIADDDWESCTRTPCAPILNNLNLIALRATGNIGLQIERNDETASYEILRPTVRDGRLGAEIIGNFRIADYDNTHDAFDAALAQADRIATNRD